MVYARLPRSVTLSAMTGTRIGSVDEELFDGRKRGLVLERSQALNMSSIGEEEEEDEDGNGIESENERVSPHCEWFRELGPDFAMAWEMVCRRDGRVGSYIYI